MEQFLQGLGIASGEGFMNWLGTMQAPIDMHQQSFMAQMTQAMAQMNTAEIADQSCGGCDLNGFAGDVLCQGGCPVPCSFGGTIGIVGLTPSVRFAMPLGVVVPVAEPLIPLGANPSLDPFPPKRPV